MFPISYDSKKKIYIFFLFLLSCFIVFLICYHWFGWSLSGHGYTECPFHKYLHLYCPGCGGTRAMDAFLQGKFLTSILYHPFIFYVAMVFVYYYIAGAYTFLKKKDGRIYYKIPTWVLVAAVVLLLVFFVIRNVLLVYGKVDFLQDLIVYWK